MCTVSLRGTTPEVPQGAVEEVKLGVGQRMVLSGNVSVIIRGS